MSTQRHSATQRRGLALRSLALAGLLAAPSASAEGLADTVSQLYGGDGINLSESSGFGHNAHFTTLSLEGLDRLGEAIASGVGNYSFSSVTTGFRLDPETGIPERISSSLGPLLAETPSTLGKGGMNFGLTYIRAEYSTFEGTDLDDLRVTLQHPDVNNDGKLEPFRPSPNGPLLDFELDQIHIDLDMDIEQDIWVHFGNFGITDRFDLGYVIPVIHTEVHAEALASIFDPTPASSSPHAFDDHVEGASSSAGGSETGIGDILIRGKYNVEDPDGGFDYAVGGQVALPTGDEDDLMGTGEARAQGILIAARQFDKFLAHWNVGYEWVPGDLALNNLRAIVGFEYAFTPRFTTSVDLLGRWEHDGDGIGDNLADLAVGAKFGLAKGVVLSANTQWALVEDGLRADLIWFVGVEGSF